MTEGNLAQDEIQKTIKELFCSKKFTGEVHKVLSLLSVLNIFLSITAFLGNTLILVALHEEASLHPLSTSKLLYRNLAISDLCVGVILEPTAITYLLSVINEKWEICYYASVINHVAANLLCALSLYTVTAISVDRLLALLLRLRYRQVTTLKRTCLSVTVIWIMCVFGTSSYFWSHSFTSWWVLIGTGRCQFTSVFSYTKLFCTLRHNQIHIQHHGSLRQPSQATPLNIPRYRKAVTSALWVQVTMTFCYLPYGIVKILRPQIGLSSSLYLSIQFTANLVLFKNSSLNPLLYCWKIREVRQAVKDTIRQFFCAQN